MLLRFIIRQAHILIFIVLELCGALLLFNYNSNVSNVFLSSANSFAGSVNELKSSILGYFSLRSINSELTERNAQLELELSTIKNMRGEDPAVLHTQNNVVCAASVVQNSVHRRDNYLTINKGAADGVTKNMTVVSGKGVVGTVYKVGTHYSLVLPILNSQSRISCMIRDRGYFGYLTWSGGDCRYAWLEDVPRHARFTRGDIIETSGFSTLFPKGLTVGKVLTTYNSPDGLAYKVKILLSTDFGNITDVCVLSNPEVREELEP